MKSSENRENVVEICLNEVRDILNNLKYGTVTIVVQDGVPIQLDTTEKKRFK